MSTTAVSSLVIMKLTCVQSRGNSNPAVTRINEQCSWVSDVEEGGN